MFVLDEKGTFAIPLLSGHVGGGVTLAKVLAEYTGGRAVITTATDVQKKFAPDVFAMENGLPILMKEGITDGDDLPAYFLAQSPGSCSVLIGKSKDGTEHDNDRKNGQWF